jgi:SAM-dependent methyltransferase
MARKRTPDELQEHYLIERQLADRLRSSIRAERRGLYAAVYDELFRRVPSHPQVEEGSAGVAAKRDVGAEVRLLEPLLDEATVFLEVGAGDCAVSIELSKRVATCYAVEVSEEIVKGVEVPPNLTLVITDGIELPIPAETVTLAYSNQVMEHLHPDDALEQLAAIHRCLAPGGRYVCLTPNRLTGPHDISKYFGDEATGFHLKEYTATELAEAFERSGFRRRRVYVGGRGFYKSVPVLAVRPFELLVQFLPARLRRVVVKSPLRGFLGIGLSAEKPARGVPPNARTS